MSPLENKQTLHSILIGEHPDNEYFLGEWLTHEDLLDSDTNPNKKIHRKLTENKAVRESAVENISKCIVSHHVDDIKMSRLEEKKRLLSKYEFSEVMKSQDLLPQLETTKRGNATEVLLAEYLQSTSSLELFLYRLRYNPNVNQSMKGDDVLLFNKENIFEKVILGEAKYRTNPSKDVIEEITKDFGKELTRPLSVTFVANMLRLAGDLETSAKLEELNLEIIKGNISLVNVGFLLSNHNTYKHVERNLLSKNPNFIMISLSVEDPKKLIDDCFEHANKIIGCGESE